MGEGLNLRRDILQLLEVMAIEMRLARFDQIMTFISMKPMKVRNKGNNMTIRECQ
jgi:hypothetical protein